MEGDTLIENQAKQPDHIFEFIFSYTEEVRGTVVGPDRETVVADINERAKEVPDFKLISIKDMGSLEKFKALAEAEAPSGSIN